MTHHATLEDARTHPRRILLILCLAAIAYSLAQTLVIPVIPAIQEETGTSASTATWMLTAFLLSSSVMTPLLGRLGDMIGKERVLLVSMLVFGSGSLICALFSHSIEMLILGRVVQGAGGAIFPLAFGIVRDELPPEKVVSGIGTISTTFGIGGGLGLVLSGFFVDHLSVAWDFWFALAFTSVSAAMVWRFIPESPVRAPGRMDYGGGALLSIALVSLLLGVSQGNTWGWGSPAIVGLIAFGLVMLAVFGRYELRFEDPMVDVRLLARRPVWSPNLAGFAVGFGMFGAYLLIPELVQTSKSTGYGFGLSVTASGLVLLPSAVVMLFTGALSGRLAARFGMRFTLVLGCAAACFAFGMLAWAHGAIWLIVLAGIPFGLGVGLAYAATASLIIAAVPQEQSGSASAVMTVARLVGGAVGGQIAGALLTAREVNALPVESGYTNAFAASFVIGVLTLGLCFLIPSDRPPGRGRRVRLRQMATARAPERAAA